MSGRRIRVYCRARPEEGETRVALAEHANTLELAERLRKIESAAVLGDDESARREKRSRAKEGENAAVFFSVGVRRIEKDNIERNACGKVFRGEALQGPQGVELQNPYATLYAKGIEILL